MPSTPAGIIVDPNGQTVTVNITAASGAAVAVYTAKDGSTVRNLPSSHTGDPVEFWVVQPDRYIVSLLVNGVENANGRGGTRTVDLRSGGTIGLQAGSVGDGDDGDAADLAAFTSGAYPAKAGTETISGAWTFTTPPAGVVASVTAGTYAQPGAATAAFRDVLDKGVADAVLVALSDSTGDATDEWVALLATYLAGQYPRYTVTRRTWTGSAYTAATTIQTSTGTRTVTDGATTNAAATLTSATAAFTSADVGRAVTGTGIPASTTIIGVTSATVAIMSANATATATGVSVTVTARTLAVYIGGQSGQGVAYALTNLTAMIPVTPDLVMVSFGHNDNIPSTYRKTYLKTTKAIQRKYPSTGLVVVAQNPKNPTNSTYSNGLQNARIIEQLAASEGYGFVNIMQAFIDYGAYTADLLTDDTHPNAAGSALWATEVQKQFVPKPKYVMPLAPRQQVERLFVPAPSFFPTEGTPTLETIGASAGSGGFPAWALDQTTREMVTSYVDLPSWWQTVAAYVYWVTVTNPGATNNAACLKLSNSSLDETGFASSFSSTAGGVVTATAQANALGINKTQLKGYNGVGEWTPPLFPLGIHVQRDAANAADTLPQDVHVLGVLFERVT